MPTIKGETNEKEQHYRSFYTFHILYKFAQKGQSDQYQVTLTQLSVASTGRYKCEVSVDAPSFQTSFSTVEMNIVGKSLTDPFQRIIAS